MIKVVVEIGVGVQGGAAQAWPSIRWTAFTLPPALITSEAAVRRSSQVPPHLACGRRGAQQVVVGSLTACRV
jgi:hypothetical protein